MDAKGVIAQAEEMIENALWESLETENWEQELAGYQKATELLTSLKGLSGAIELERKRVLSYCLMRIDEALVKLEREEGAIRRAEESLELAIQSGDKVQIARSKLALGIRLLNEGKLPAAESHFGDIITEGQDSEDEDMKQVVGWAFLVRANILKGKSLYDQALYIAETAAGLLAGIKNYAGLAQTYSLIAKLQMDLGNPGASEDASEASEAYAKKAKELRQ
ncbi:MAG: hypothetical protein P1Q69_13780 [Candidatus Thorarchaeota archaeon]|nr:hypothetical protein [Candidatus Thorarchaeota archaeon]